jgi:hypothetical protein
MRAPTAPRIAHIGDNAPAASLGINNIHPRETLDEYGIGCSSEVINLRGCEPEHS